MKDRRKSRIRSDVEIGEFVIKNYGWYVLLTDENILTADSPIVYQYSDISGVMILGFVAWHPKEEVYYVVDKRSYKVEEKKSGE